MRIALTRKILSLGMATAVLLPLAATRTAAQQQWDWDYVCAFFYAQGDYINFYNYRCNVTYTDWDTFGTVYLVRPTFAHGLFRNWHRDNDWDQRWHQSRDRWNKGERDDSRGGGGDRGPDRSSSSRSTRSFSSRPYSSRSVSSRSWSRASSPWGGGSRSSWGGSHSVVPRGR